MDYDGDTANIHINQNEDGKEIDNYDISIDDEGLENMLNMKSVNIPIDQRLKNDFREKIQQRKETPYYAYEVINKPIIYKPSNRKLKHKNTPRNPTIRRKPNNTYKINKKRKANISRKNRIDS